MSNQWEQWAKSVADKLKADSELSELVQHWKNTPGYIYPFDKTKYQLSKHDSYVNMLHRAENKAIEVMNDYKTKLVRQYL